MERILALDIGYVRIGVAISDPLGIFAQGVCVLQNKRGGTKRWQKLQGKGA